MILRILLIMIISALLSSTIQAQGNGQNVDQILTLDSMNIIWQALEHQKIELDSLTSEYRSVLEKMKIQAIGNQAQIDQWSSLKEQINSLLSRQGNGDFSSNRMTVLVFVFMLIPLVFLFFLIIYIKYKQKKELKTINDNLHQYLNESRKLLEDLSLQLEKTTAEAVAKSKSRLKILELIVAEAGQKLKPLTAIQNSQKEATASHFPSINTKPATAPIIEKAPIQTKPNLFQRYKSGETQFNKKSEEISPNESSDSKNHTSMIWLLHKKGLSITQIASRLSMGKGEVELILNLQKRKFEQSEDKN